MKYLIMIYSNPASREIWASFSDEERAEGWNAYTALNAALTASGELIISEALEDPSRGKRVLVDEGRVVVSDGPFAEAKEVLAGFILVECVSIDRAIEIAARVPEAELDLVEVRPVISLGEP